MNVYLASSKRLKSFEQEVVAITNKQRPPSGTAPVTMISGTSRCAGTE